jgi:hypothetical protein
MDVNSSDADLESPRNNLHVQPVFVFQYYGHALSLRFQITLRRYHANCASAGTLSTKLLMQRLGRESKERFGARIKFVV